MMEFHLVTDIAATGEITPAVAGLATELGLQ